MTADFPDTVSADVRTAGSRSARLWEIACVAAIAAICLTRAAFRGIPVTTHGLDVLVALDGAWRVLNGQRPHVDFYSALGPLSPLSTAFGLLLAHGAAQGINYGNAVLGFAVGLWSLRIARARMSPPFAALIAVFCVLLMVAPAAPGEAFSAFSEAMFYDRYGFALVTLILVEGFATPRENASTFAGGISSGVCCGLLLFLKASYFFVAAPLIVSMFVVRRPDSKRIAGLLIGFAAVLLAVLVYLGFHVGAIVGDLRIAAGARRERLASTGINWSLILRNTIASDAGLLLLAAMAAFLTPARRVLFAAILVVGAGAALLLSNFQFGAMPLNVALAILICDAVRRNPGSMRSGLRAVFAAVAFCVVVPQLATNVRTLVSGLRASFVPADSPRVALIHSRVLGSVYWMNAWTGGRRYIETINEGMELLSRSVRQDETVYTMAFVNPFSYAMQRRPAHGGSTWLHARYNYSDDYKPTPEWLLGETDVVMAPKEQDLIVAYALHNYGGYLMSHFRVEAESKNWLLYRKVR